MSSDYGTNLLNSLTSANWDITKNTFGNSHATLIGILVQWWIDSAPATHYVLESVHLLAITRRELVVGFVMPFFVKDQMQ